MAFLQELRSGRLFWVLRGSIPKCFLHFLCKLQKHFQSSALARPWGVQPAKQRNICALILPQPILKYNWKKYYSVSKPQQHLSPPHFVISPLSLALCGHASSAPESLTSLVQKLGKTQFPVNNKSCLSERCKRWTSQRAGMTRGVLTKAKPRW